MSTRLFERGQVHLVLEKEKRGYNGSADVTVHVIVEQTWVKEGENPSPNGRERGTRIYIFSSKES